MNSELFNKELNTLDTQNTFIKDFLSELEKIKKSSPEKKVVLEQVKDDSSFLNSLFGSKKIVERTVYNEVDIEGFISVNQFTQLVYKYFDFIYQKSQEIIEKLMQKAYKRKDLYFELFHNSRIYLRKKGEYGCNETILDIEYSNFPELRKGRIEEYELIKEDIFELISYLKNLCLMQTKSFLSDNSYINISYMNKNDIFYRRYPFIKFCICNVAVIEVSKKVGEAEKYTSYADNIELFEFLRKNSEELFYSCYLKDDTELVKLLKRI